MKIHEASLPGVLVLEPEPIRDERGSFARTFCRRELLARGVDVAIAQTNISENRRRGTLRGLHYQAAPHAEAKLVSCLFGALFDVVVDLRDGSPTRGRWLGIALDAVRREMLYIPPGFAHGFQTLADETVVSYFMTEYHQPEAARGIRWDDPTLAIAWPIADPILSSRDAAWGPFTP